MTTRPPVRVAFAGSRLPPELLAAFRLAPDITPLLEPLELHRLVAYARRQRPDVVVVDLGTVADEALNGMAAMMADWPAPILALYPAGGSGDPNGHALRAGAVETMPRPAAWTAANAAAVCDRIRVLSGVAVLRRSQPVRRSPGQPGQGRLVAIGASTGGPAALAAILAGLEGVPSPVLIVQHMRPEFLPDLLQWLTRASALPIELARQHESLVDGVAYLAPSGVHLRLGDDRRTVIDASPPALHRPSVDQMFSSVAAVMGSGAVGVLLTGMGSDGAAGLLEIRRRGGVTIAQDEATSAVFGMPKCAWDLGAVCIQLPVAEIGAAVHAATRRVPV